MVPHGDGGDLVDVHSFSMRRQLEIKLAFLPENDPFLHDIRAHQLCPLGNNLR